MDADLIERLRAAVTYQYMPMSVRRLLSEAATALTNSGEAVHVLDREHFARLHRLQHDGIPVAKPKLGGSLTGWAADEITALRAATRPASPSDVVGVGQEVTEMVAIGIDGSRHIFVRAANGSWPAVPTRTDPPAHCATLSAHQDARS